MAPWIPRPLQNLTSSSTTSPATATTQYASNTSYGPNTQSIPPVYAQQTSTVYNPMYNQPTVQPIPGYPLNTTNTNIPTSYGQQQIYGQQQPQSQP